MKHFKTITEFHQFVEIPPPLHPLISVVDVATVPHREVHGPMSMAMNFYSISVKRMVNFKVQYGQRPFDFNEGIMSFLSPNQVLKIEVDDKTKVTEKSGWVIYIHPDFLWNTSLAKTIRDYDFWDYSLNESLFLSEKEEAMINSIMQNISEEYQANIDKFSKNIIISQLETLLRYSDRYYHRQFITREKSNHQTVQKVENLLLNYFNNDELTSAGLVSVAYLADAMNLSPKYLSTLLKVQTGMNAQQHIHEKLIEKAKEKLSASELSVSEVAYSLGFEHLPSFSKFFKAKTNQSPLEFRAAFN